MPYCSGGRATGVKKTLQYVKVEEYSQNWGRDGRSASPRIGFSRTVIDSRQHVGQDIDSALFPQELGYHEKAGTAEVWGGAPAQGAHTCVDKKRPSSHGSVVERTHLVMGLINGHVRCKHSGGSNAKDTILT